MFCSLADLEGLLAALMTEARHLVRHERAPVEGALEHLETLAESSECAVLFTSQTRILAANRASRKLTGYSRRELTQMRVPDLIAPEHRGNPELALTLNQTLNPRP